jgi:hypothetical protein
MTGGAMRLGLCFLVLTGLCVALPACGRGDGGSPPSRPAGRELAPPDQVYTVRGRIVELPDPARPASGLQILHEAIDDFVWKDGRIGGMDAMVMPFTPAAELSLAEFAVDDDVELTFEVRWTASPLSRVIAMRKLPPDTQLEFRKAQPPDPSADR